MTKTTTTRIITVLLSLSAGGIIGGAGMWLWQPKSASSGDQLAENPQLLQVCKDLTKGDTQALLDVMAIQLDEYYMAHYIEKVQESPAEHYRQMIMDGMDAAYAYYFEGKDIEVRPVNMKEVIIPAFDGADTAFSPSYMYEFYENDQLLLTMTFSQIRDGKFDITEQYAWEDDGTTEMLPSFTSAVVPLHPSFIEEMFVYSNLHAQEEKKDAFYCYAFGTDDTFRETIKEKTRTLYANGWVFSDVMMNRSKFDTEIDRWTYVVRFTVEHPETGASFIMQQQFAYFEEHLYPIEHAEPTIIAETGDVPETVKEVLLNLF